MFAGQFVEMRIVCPHCTQTNRLTVDTGIGDFPFDCSYCRRTIGHLRDLEPVPLPEGSVGPAGRVPDYDFGLRNSANAPRRPPPPNIYSRSGPNRP